MMNEKNTANECSDPTQSLTVQLPCQMVERVERYAKDTGTNFTGVLIEAVDQFLRNRNEISSD